MSERSKIFVTAYNMVCKSQDPYRTYKVLNELEFSALEVSPWEIRGILPSEYLEDFSSYLAQTILRSNRRRVNPEIMTWAADLSHKKISIPYPRSWRKNLERQGVPVDPVKSGLSFFFIQIRTWGKFLGRFFQHIVLALSSYPCPRKEYDAFLGLPDTTIPLVGRQSQEYTVVDWFRRHNYISSERDVVIQSSKLRACEKRGEFLVVPNIFPILSKRGCSLYILKSLQTFCAAFLSWMAGNWKAPFAALAALDIIYFKQIDNPARSYFFSNSDFAVRPFWSYAAEKSGSNVCLYFYSSNINCFYNGQEKDSPPPPGYILMSWPKYMVIDKDQEEFLIDCCRAKGKIDVVGSIDFSDSDDALPDVPKRSIALFDISPFNVDHVASLALIAPYYTADILADFLQDIVECARELDGYIIWKRKREVPDSFMSDHYRKTVSLMQNDPRVILVPPGISARRLVEKVDAAVSIPFTSTALLAKELGKKSSFYDPTSKIGYLKGLSRDLPFLRGKDSLKRWMEEVLRGM